MAEKKIILSFGWKYAANKNEDWFLLINFFGWHSVNLGILHLSFLILWPKNVNISSYLPFFNSLARNLNFIIVEFYWISAVYWDFVFFQSSAKHSDRGVSSCNWSILIDHSHDGFNEFPMVLKITNQNRRTWSVCGAVYSYKYN